MSDKVLKESYVERFAREQKEKEAGDTHGQTAGSEGQEAKKEKRRRKQASVVKESDHR